MVGVPNETSKRLKGIAYSGGSTLVTAPTAQVHPETSSELDEGEIIPDSVFSIESLDARKAKTLLALDVLDADDEEIRSAARDRLVAEWSIKYDDSEKELRLQIAKALLRVGSGEIKEEAKRVLMSELKIVK